MAILSDDLRPLRNRLIDARRCLAPGAKAARRAEPGRQTAPPDRWDDQTRAISLSREFGRIDDDIEMLTDVRRLLDDRSTLHKLAVGESDESVARELESSVAIRFSVEVNEETEEQEAGLLCATSRVTGRGWGLFSAERGVHRPYRIGPFDSPASATR